MADWGWLSKAFASLVIAGIVAWEIAEWIFWNRRDRK